MATPYDCEVFSIHDAYVNGAEMGDVDDIAAIFYLARKFASKRIIIYIVNDIELEIGTNKSKLDKFNEEYGKKLRKICKNIIFFGISGIYDNNLIGITDKNELNTNSFKELKNLRRENLPIVKQRKKENYNRIISTFPDNMYNYLINSKKIIICAPINNKDNFLLDTLNSIVLKEDQQLYCQGNPMDKDAYNFQDIRCKLNKNKDGNNTYIGNNIVNWYDTTYTNRRFKKEQLNEIIDDNQIILTIMKYAIMKVIFLPSGKFAMGLCVSNPELGTQPVMGAGKGNNIIGLLIYNKPKQDSPIPPTKPFELLQEYFESKLPANENKTTENINQLVENKIKGTFIEKFTLDIINKNENADEEVKRRFKYAMAYIVESIPKLLNNPANFTQMVDLKGAINSGLHHEIRDSSTNISSPMWDLIAMYYAINGITRKSIEDDHTVNDPKIVNSIITDELFTNILMSMSPTNTPVKSMSPAIRPVISMKNRNEVPLNSPRSNRSRISTFLNRSRLPTLPKFGVPRLPQSKNVRRSVRRAFGYNGGFIRKKSKKIYKHKH
jgi:hypothetical protein